MQLVVLLVLAWYVGLAATGRAEGQSFAVTATLRFAVGFLVLAYVQTVFLFGFSPTLVHTVLAVAAVACIALGLRRGGTLPAAADFRPLLPANPYEWWCACVVAASLVFGTALLFAPPVFTGESLVLAQRIRMETLLSGGVWSNVHRLESEFPSYHIMHAHLYAVAGVSAARLLTLLLCALTVAVAAAAGGWIAGRCAAWTAAALCTCAPMVLNMAQGLSHAPLMGTAWILFLTGLLVLHEREGKTVQHRILLYGMIFALLAAPSTAALASFAALCVACAHHRIMFSPWVYGVAFGVACTLFAIVGAALGWFVPMTDAAFGAWDAVMRPEGPAQWAGHPGVAVFALGVPAIFLGSWKVRTAGVAGMTGIVWTALVDGGDADRFGPYLLLLLAGAGLVADAGKGRNLVLALAVIAMAAGTLQQVQVFRDRLPLLSGRETPNAFLNRHIPRYGAIEYCNNFHPDAPLYLFEPLGFYASGLASAPHPTTLRVMDKLLQSEDGFPERIPDTRGLLILPSAAILRETAGLDDDTIELLERLRRESPPAARVRRLDLPHPHTGEIQRIDILRIPHGHDLSPP